MKSVNHFLAIIFFVILYPNNSFSQSNFKAGYVIDIQKDTIRGFIDYRNWDKTPKKIVFKTVSDLITIYTPINIKCFSVASEIYVSGIVTIDESPFRENELTESIMPQNRTDTVFLQILINGPKSLYYLKDKNLKEHYFIGQNGGFETLFFKKYLQNINGAMYSKTNEQYKGQLVVYFQDYLSIQKKIYSVTYSKKDLIELFKEYYKYTQNKILYQSDPEKMKSEFGLLGGLSQTKLKFIGSDDYYKVLYNTDYPLSQNFTFGVFYNIILPRKQGKFSIDNELMFTSYKLNIINLDSNNANIYSKSYISVGASYIKINNLLKFKYPIKEMFLFVDGGISNGIAFSSTNHLRIEDHVYSINNISEGEALRNERKWERGFILGLGSNFKNYSFEFRFERADGMSNYVLVKSPTIRYFFILGYKF